MMLVGQQNDSYLSTLAVRQQRDIDMFTENLVGVYPGLSSCQTTCQIGSSSLPAPPVGINQYVMNISNYAGIDSLIVRIYINSSASPGCYPTPCILNPSTTASANSFRMSDGLVNPGEFGHQVVLWLPSTVTFSPSPPPLNTVSISTVRGRIFTLQYPFPKIGGNGGPGGTGLNIGPLLIRYETDMITYSIYNESNPNTYPRPTPGGWVFPTSTPLIFFIKVYNQGVSSVTLVSQSNFQLQQYGTPGNVLNFFLVAPMSTTLCTGTFQTIPNGDPYGESPYCGSGGSISGGNTFPTSTKTVVGYSISQAYVIPQPPQAGVCCSPPVYLLFSAATPRGSSAASISVNSKGPPVYYSYLNLAFEYNNGGGIYSYGVDLPFIVVCGGSNPTGSYGQTCAPSEV